MLLLQFSSYDEIPAEICHKVKVSQDGKFHVVDPRDTDPEVLQRLFNDIDRTGSLSSGEDPSSRTAHPECDSRKSDQASTTGPKPA